MAFADDYYTVKPGDSLWKISKNYSLSVEQIQKLNSLNSTLIFPGQKILIAQNSQSDAPSMVSRGTSRIETILEYAKSFAGVPYRYGGQSPQGFDCSGFIQYVFKNFGLAMPRIAADQYYAGREIDADEALPGDIVAFKTGKVISHTGIYLGGGKFISATSSSGIDTALVKGPYWGERLFGFSRVLP